MKHAPQAGTGDALPRKPDENRGGAMRYKENEQYHVDQVWKNGLDVQ
jgi:hypothetical protein